MLKVSVIVPVYNSEKYIESCIRSVMLQTYTEWELLLINDGSKDSSQKICSIFSDADERIRLISQENKGVSAARNTGLGYAEGEYITFVDSDDELEANAIETLVNDIEHYGADICSASKCIVNVNGTQTNVSDDGTIEIYENFEMIKRSLLYDKFTRSLHGKLFRREFLSDIRFVDGHNINEDGYFLFMCYTKCPKVVQHNVSVYRYFTREDSASRSKFSEKYFDMIYFCDLKMKYIRENMPDLMEFVKDMEVRTHLLFLDVLCREGSDEYIKAAKDSVKIIRKGYLKFKPSSKHEKLLSFAAAMGLYPAYRSAYRAKYVKG